MSLSPIQNDAWPPEIDHLRDGFTGRANVYRTMAHHPALLDAWSHLRKHVVTQNALGPERIEVVILRTGHRLGASYEWNSHILRGRAAGLSDARIRSIADAPHRMAATDSLLARAVDALIDDARLPPDLQARIAESLGHHAMLDLIATVGFYSTLAYLVNSFDVPLDADVAAALAEKPLG